VNVEAERRQVTVLFADMVGFTTFSERSGEEAAFTLMRSLSKLMDGAVRAQGGVVQAFTGDGIMAVFGAPIAFEDAPLRACRAALTIQQQLVSARPDLEAKHGVRPRLRIGLNSGAAVVGKVEDRADAGVTVLGDTVNFAARLQALAAPDSVLMSEATHRLMQGLVEASFGGEHSIKGKSEPQKVFRLDGIRHGVTRFDAAVARGLSSFVGREHELELLEKGLTEARSELRVIDISAEPGMGKSRLLHEFRQRIGKERAFVLSGSCSRDGEQIPFLPFIEMVRGSFRVSTGEPEADVAQKLEVGLTSLGLHSVRNLGLLLHLLGLKVPEDALSGLDDVLIGLRTRELLQQLVEARRKLSPVLMLIEDLHWTDSASEELLGKIVNGERKLRLLIIHTHRPEYTPRWLNHAGVTRLRLEPLPSGDIRRLVQARLGAETLPDALARQVAEKAEGNPLFAEEVASFLLERGILHTKDAKLEFDAGAVAAALPVGVQGVLNARVDRLAPKDRTLLQAASVIGRRFKLELLAVVLGETEIDGRLAAMEALDLIRFDDRSSDYVFKHALVRDALYQSILTEHRLELHSKIAQEIERRGGNRLGEVAEVLAHHYSQTNHTDKVFVYLSMAGGRSLGVYSLDAAATYFTAALAVLDSNPECASNDQVLEFLYLYVKLLVCTNKWKAFIDVGPRFLARVDRTGDDLKAYVGRVGYFEALILNGQYREAAAIQQQLLRLDDRLGDSRSRAWGLFYKLVLSAHISPMPINEFEIVKREARTVLSEATDAYLQNGVRWYIGLEEFSRGRLNETRNWARELMKEGQSLDDPRSTGMAFLLLSMIAVVSGSNTEALEYSEQSLSVAITPFERFFASGTKASALVLLGRNEEGAKLLEEFRCRCEVDGIAIMLDGTEVTLGFSKILQGSIADGIHVIEKAILKAEKIGHKPRADWFCLSLANVYLEIMAGGEKKVPLRKVQLPTLLKNLPVLLKVMFTGGSRIQALMTRVLENPHFDPAGHHVGHAKMILGLLYKNKKKRTLAIQHLAEAKRILSQFGPTPILARVDTALAELKQ
jgi:class 3 adenylate cyclase/tetratricopeptide (TPR) repeat protein